MDYHVDDHQVLLRHVKTHTQTFYKHGLPVATLHVVRKRFANGSLDQRPSSSLPLRLGQSQWSICILIGFETCAANMESMVYG